MNAIPELLRIRVVAGYLGEKSQCSWWSSDFFSATAPSFLDPVFPRTRFLAQAEGSAAAARRLHDERIGVGRVFHLFRLPEDFEQTFHERLQASKVAEEITGLLANKETALAYLEQEYGQATEDGVGPILIGSIGEVTQKPTIAAIGQAYLHGFTTGSPMFPYLKDD